MTQIDKQLSEQDGLAKQLEQIYDKKQPVPRSTQKITQKRKQKKLTPLEKFLKKDHGSVHAEEVADYKPTRSKAIPRTNNEAAYGTLTDDSTYSEYAWEFLRRNRFYKQVLDKPDSKRSLENWDYASKTIHGHPTGIINLKHYTEKYTEGTPVEWYGIHDFRDQLKHAKPNKRHTNHTSVSIDYPSNQVAIIFDIDPLFNGNTTAIDLQIDMAKVHLHELAKERGIIFPEKITPPNKKRLRALLRITDLLSAPRTISIASDFELNDKLKAEKTILDAKSNPRLGIKEVSTLLPAYDFGKDGNRSSSEAERLRVKHASELAHSAWDNIYNMKFLQWLQHDQWTHLVQA